MPGAAALLTSAAIVFAGSQPQLASLNERVYLTFGQGDAISVERSVDGGETFGHLSVLRAPGRLSLGMHRGPRIAVTDQALLVTAVMGTKGGGADGDVVLFRLTDDGATWAPAVVINDVPAAAREGLHATAASRAGLVVVAWLDLRQKGTRIYAAVSRDHGATWAADTLVYASPSGAVCECCHPSVAVTADGQVAIMFRNNLDGRRDMYLTRSRDGVSFAPPTKIGTGTWVLNACPMDGGGIDFDGRDVISAWRREDGVYLSTSGASEWRVAAGRDPVVRQSGNRRDVAWSSTDGVFLMRGSEARIAIGPGRFPSIVVLPQRTVIAWEHQGEVLVRAVPR